MSLVPRTIPDVATAGVNPEVSRQWNDRDATMLSAESYLEALEAAETAIRFDPSNTMARNNKSIALLGLQNDSDALIAAEKAISLKSDNAVAWSNKGVALRKLARYDEDPEFKKLLR